MVEDAVKQTMARCASWDIAEAYTGPMEENVVTRWEDMFLDYLIAKGIDSSVYPSTRTVIIESFQNIRRYGRDIPPYVREKYGEGIEAFGTYVLGVDGGDVKVLTANFVKPEKIRIIDEKLKRLLSLSYQELREESTSGLEEDFTEAGGAGLGFYQILRATNRPVEYFFDEQADGYYYFCVIHSLDKESCELRKRIVAEMREARRKMQ